MGSLTRHPLAYTHAALLHPCGLAFSAVERAGICAARSGARRRLGLHTTTTKLSQNTRPTTLAAVGGATAEVPA